MNNGIKTNKKLVKYGFMYSFQSALYLGLTVFFTPLYATLWNLYEIFDHNRCIACNPSNS